ncbi:GtrA family protein [Gulosibacter faecalis]|jgi:putative flippase GtrA|uniref:GtrA family protein n=1 Tax=Gulosibacter faecalis TaxID=272240 RepID=A0ABW5UY43_9MICO|nr:GtrA family protein [Gulosibacter faecalis]
MRQQPQRDDDPSWRDSRHPHSGAIAIIAAEEADARTHPDAHPRRGSRDWWGHLVTQLFKFGLIGGLGVIVDMGVFNLLRATVLSPSEVTWGPMAANIIGTLVAIVFNWAGNRFWTFRKERHITSTSREAIEFFAVSIAGLLIGLVPLWITHYGIGWTSPLADNISKLVGIGLGSIFRFALYRWWVYSPRRAVA